MKTQLTPLEITDVTVKFIDRIWELKTGMDYSIIEAMKHITYLTDMYVYSNIYLFGNNVIEFKTQSGEEINNYSIFFLN